MQISSYQPTAAFRDPKARSAIRDGLGNVCGYCGRRTQKGEQALRPQIDHVLPKCLGGTDDPDNLRLACQTCNYIKGNRHLDEARHHLVLHKIGWPKFSTSQIAWMRERGLDLSEYDDCKLHYELS